MPLRQRPCDRPKQANSRTRIGPGANVPGSPSRVHLEPLVARLLMPDHLSKITLVDHLTAGRTGVKVVNLL